MMTYSFVKVFMAVTSWDFFVRTQDYIEVFQVIAVLTQFFYFINIILFINQGIFKEIMPFLIENVAKISQLNI